MKLGDEIKRMRMSQCWSQQKLAEVLQYSQHAVSNWESNNRLVNFNTLLDIAEATGHRIKFEKKVLGEDEMKNEINEIIEELMSGYEEHKEGLETLVVVLDEKGLLVLHHELADDYLEHIIEADFICTILPSDFEKGFEYIREKIETNFLDIVNSHLYKIKSTLYNEFSKWSDIEYELDIYNNYIFINKIKLCRIEYIESIEQESDSIKLHLIDGSVIYIVMKWLEGEEPYICQIYREKMGEDDYQIYSNMLYNTLY